MLSGAPIVDAEAMRTAEHQTVAGGTSAEKLMMRAAKALADLVIRVAAGRPVLILCGPGNNGGDGYAAATLLRNCGVDVRIVAVAMPTSDLCQLMASCWDGHVECADDAAVAPILIDAIYGTGARGGLPEDLTRFWQAAERVIAVDLPSVLNADQPGDAGRFAADVTLALGALKPAHVLEPGASACGQLLLDTLGIPGESDVRLSKRPRLQAPGAQNHKYTRGVVGVVAGAMPGAAVLAAEAASRSGAGYVRLAINDGSIPRAIVLVDNLSGLLAGRRPDALVIGPGLTGDGAASQVAGVRAADLPMVFDGGALDHLLGMRFSAPTILTPHEGEFIRLFGDGDGNKIDRTRAAALKANAVVIHKGADTVIAGPDGRVRIAPRASAWLSTAGSGDVLAGLCAGFLAQMPQDAMRAAEAAAWVHAEAARLCGPAFIADDLARAVSRALSAFL